MKHAIIMPSFGNRAWVGRSAQTFKIYASSIGASFILETEIPRDFLLPDLNATIGRPNKFAYACKSFLAYKHLNKYERVVVVDDSCCVKRGAADIFEATPFGYCGFTTTSPDHANKSFNTIKAFIEKTRASPIPYETGKYMNSALWFMTVRWLMQFHQSELKLLHHFCWILIPIRRFPTTFCRAVASGVIYSQNHSIDFQQ